jgi:hypothetical protein
MKAEHNATPNSSYFSQLQHSQITNANIKQLTDLNKLEWGEVRTMSADISTNMQISKHAQKLVNINDVIMAALADMGQHGNLSAVNFNDNDDDDLAPAPIGNTFQVHHQSSVHPAAGSPNAPPQSSNLTNVPVAVGVVVAEADHASAPPVHTAVATPVKHRKSASDYFSALTSSKHKQDRQLAAQAANAQAALHSQPGGPVATGIIVSISAPAAASTSESQGLDTPQTAESTPSTFSPRQTNGSAGETSSHQAPADVQSVSNPYLGAVDDSDFFILSPESSEAPTRMRTDSHLTIQRQNSGQFEVTDAVDSAKYPDPEADTEQLYAEQITKRLHRLVAQVFGEEALPPSTATVNEVNPLADIVSSVSSALAVLADATVATVDTIISSALSPSQSHSAAGPRENSILEGRSVAEAESVGDKVHDKDGTIDLQSGSVEPAGGSAEESATVEDAASIGKITFL